MTQTFTAHNVSLDDGTETAPHLGYNLKDFPHVSVVKQLANLAFRDDLSRKTIVDLGCLEGGFTTEFARVGLQSTCIEVRSSNFANCMIIKNGVNLSNLRFIHDDAWNVGRYGPFDIVFCVGLFYHIDKITEFMDLLSANCRSIMFLDTHYSPEEDGDPSVTIHKLSPLTSHEGLPGRWFAEHDLEPDSNELDDLKWASWGNRSSFWPTRAGLLQLMAKAGFTSFESFFYLGVDPINQMSPTSYYKLRSRAVFVGLRS